MAKKESNEQQEEFTHDATAYLPVYNKETKLYEMWCIRVNTETAEMLVDIEETRYDTHHRALHDTVARITNDMVKGNK